MNGDVRITEEQRFRWFCDIRSYSLCSKLRVFDHVEDIFITMTGGSVEVVSSKGCSRLFVGSSTFLPSASSLRFMSMMSPASSSLSEPTVPLVNGPFAGLVICVTGLSKGI